MRIQLGGATSCDRERRTIRWLDKPLCRSGRPEHGRRIRGGRRRHLYRLHLSQPWRLVARYGGTGDENMDYVFVIGGNGNYTAYIYRNVNGTWTRRWSLMRSARP